MTGYNGGRHQSYMDEKASVADTLPEYKFYDAESDSDTEPDLQRLTLDWHKTNSRPGSLLRTKLVIGIDFGTT